MTNHPGSAFKRRPADSSHTSHIRDLISTSRNGKIVGLDYTSVAMALLALAAWILAHGYKGIIHDNRIYALLAIRYADPRALSEDLFLKFGSQDSFTFFSPIYAWFIDLFGLDVSTKLLVAAGQALWITGAFALVRSLLTPRLAWLALVFLAAYPSVYGGNLVFSFGEGFLSPRLFAEGFGLSAIAAYLNRRFWLSGMFLLMGALLHPLMIAAPAAVILILLLMHNQSLWMMVTVVSGGTLLLVSAIAAGHHAAPALLPMIDPEWKFIVEHRTIQAMLANWTVNDWLIIGGDVILVALAALGATAQTRRLLVAVTAVALASLALSFIGFELLDDLFIGKTQVWRAVWLLHVLAPISIALIIQNAASTDPADLRLIRVLGCSFVVVATICYGWLVPMLGLSVLFLLAAVCLFAMMPRWRGHWRSRDRLMTWIGFVALMLFIAQSLASAAVYGLIPISISLTNPLFRSLLATLPIIIASALLFSPFQSGKGLVAASLAGLAALSLLASSLHWDQREEWRRYVDSTPDLAPELPLKIASTDVIYWSTDVMMMWGVLKNPSFYSDVQGAGVIFNRKTAVQYLERLRLVDLLEPDFEWNAKLLGKPEPSAMRGTEEVLQISDLVFLCSQREHPDVLVLSQDVPGTKRRAWRPRVPYTRTFAVSSASDGTSKRIAIKKTVNEYFFYRCAELAATQTGSGLEHGTDKRAAT